MSRLFHEYREILFLILGFILVVAGLSFILGGTIGFFGEPSRVGWLTLLAFAVTMLGLPAGLSLVLGIILLVLGILCYKQADK